MTVGPIGCSAAVVAERVAMDLHHRRSLVLLVRRWLARVHIVQRWVCR